MCSTKISFSIIQFTFPMHFIFTECTLEFSPIIPYKDSLTFSLLFFKWAFICAFLCDLNTFFLQALFKITFESYTLAVKLSLPIKLIVFQLPLVCKFFPYDLTPTMHLILLIQLAYVLCSIGKNLPTFV